MTISCYVAAGDAAHSERLNHRLIRQLLERVAALSGLVFLLPLMCLVMLAIRLDSPGPALFAQTRIGRNGRRFTCYKLRTMLPIAPQSASHEIAPSMITPVGRFLRAWHLDELPQLWCVVRGEMAFVGPRPCLPRQYELIVARQELGVNRLLPGITGIAQIQGVDMSTPRRLAMVDATYFSIRGWRTDLRIIAATLLGARSSGPTEAMPASA